MGAIKSALVAGAEQEWEYFGRSTRSIDEIWHIVGDRQVEPWLSHISQYWAAVGEPTWNGATDEPWSGAFISWCFKHAGAEGKFAPDETHSVYIDRIRRHAGMSEALVLKPVAEAAPEVGDLIWNSRGPGAPPDYAAAIERLEAGDFFPGHVDIVVEVAKDCCSSIGGNVSNVTIGGSVTRSTWRLVNGLLVDDRKIWLGVVKNGL